MVALRIAVVGHVEHVTLGRTDGVPRPGDIIHLQEARFLPGGGGGLAFAQLCRSDAELHLFTAVGSDEAGQAVAARLQDVPARVHIHAAVRPDAHPRVVVIVDENGQRTIVVTAPPLQPAAGDPLPWALLGTCDAVYFTGADPASLRCARAARRLLVTARRACLSKSRSCRPISSSTPRISTASPSTNRSTFIICVSPFEHPNRSGCEAPTTGARSGSPDPRSGRAEAPGATRRRKAVSSAEHGEAAEHGGAKRRSGRPRARRHDEEPPSEPYLAGGADA